MPIERFRETAHELALRDRGLCEALAVAREGAALLRERALRCIETFRRAVREQGAPHLGEIQVGEVEPDEKHVDCVQFKVMRGRWEVTCVAKARGAVTLVGPYRRGKPEKPCQDHALHGDTVEAALEDLLLQLIREASQR